MEVLLGRQITTQTVQTTACTNPCHHPGVLRAVVADCWKIETQEQQT